MYNYCIRTFKGNLDSHRFANESFKHSANQFDRFIEKNRLKRTTNSNQYLAYDETAQILT